MFSSKAFLSSDEVKILLQCMKIHAGYIQSRLDLESSEVFIPLSLVKVVKAEDITFSDVLETVLVNETEKCQKTPEIKEYVVSKIKYIMFLASFDFALTKRVFEVKGC